jgi:uncharacterized membrane protein
VALMSLGGLALIAAGEVVYRRVGSVAAAGLYGAGVAVLFVVSFAGHRYYDLYASNIAFVLMAVVTLVGCAVAVRGNLVSIAVLSLLGGNLAPLVLRGGTPGVPFFSYLLMLQIVAIALSGYGRGGKWWGLRGLSLATTSLWMVAVMTDRIADEPYGPVLWFSLLYAGLFHIELILSAFRARAPHPATSPDKAGARYGIPPAGVDLIRGDAGAGVTFSLMVTAALTVALVNLFRHEPQLVRGLWTLGLSACCVAAGFALLRVGRNGAVHALSVGYRIQAAALVVVSVPVALSGMWITVAWGALALAFALLGAALDLSVSRRAAVVTWVLAVGNLVLWSLPVVGQRSAWATWATVWGQDIPAYAVLAALLALAGHGVAVLLRENWRNAAAAPAAAPRLAVADEFTALARFTAVWASIVFAGAMMSALPVVGATFALIVYGWLLIGGEFLAPRRGLATQGVGILAAAAVKWLVADTLWRRLDHPQWVTAYDPFLNAVVGAGVLLLASVVALYWLWPRLAPAMPSPYAQAPRRLASFAGVIILLWLGTMEIDRYFEVLGADTGSDSVPTLAGRDALRAKQMALSIFWSVFAVCSVVAGFRVRAAALRYFGLGLFALTLVKVVLVDLGDVGRGYRILSFLGLGLLLLGTSVLYGKLSPLLLGQPDRR